MNKAIGPSARTALTWFAAASLAACSGGISSVDTTMAVAAFQFKVGGSVTGLTGSNLVLQNNGGDNLAITANGTFAFATPLIRGDSYSISVSTEPSAPNQTCLATNNTGTVGSSNVSNIASICADKPASSNDTIGGTAVGIVGSGLVLQNSNGDNLSVTANGAFTFAMALMPGSPFSVSVLSPPISPYQDCVIANGTGTAGSADITNVAVSCKTNPNPAYKIGGTISGVSGTIVLQDNGRDSRPLSADGTFQFTIPIPSGSVYDVTALSASGQQSQTCQFTNASGIVASSDVTNVTVVCTANVLLPVTVSGLAGSGLVLQDNGGDNLLVANNGTATFASPLARGAAYSVTVLTQPTGYACSVANGTGVIANAAVTNVAVSCSQIGGYLYVTNGGGNNISGFAIDANTGGLQPLTQIVAAAAQPNAIIAATDMHPSSIASGCALYSPVGNAPKSIYVANSISGTVGAYSLDTNTNATSGGALTLITTPAISAGTTPGYVDFDLYDCAAFALNSGSSDISVYTTGASGALMAAPGSPVIIKGSAPAAAGNARIPGGNYPTYEYVASRVTNNVTAYSVASGGALTFIIGSNPIASGVNPSAVATDVLMTGFVGASFWEPYVYVANQGSNTISVYQGDYTTGVLAPLGEALAAGNGPTALALVSGGLLYVANGADNTISAYSIATSLSNTGTLTPLGITVATGTNPVAMSYAVVGNASFINTTYLYVVNNQSNDVYVYRVTTTAGGTIPYGTLTPIGKFAVGSAPTSIAIPFALSSG